MTPKFCLVCLILFSAPAIAFSLTDDQREEASDLYAKYRVASLDGDVDDAEKVVEAFCDDLPPEAARLILPFVLKDTEKAFALFQRAAAVTLKQGDPKRMTRDPRVREAREILEEIREISDEGEMKTRLKADGKEAFHTLEELLLPNHADILRSDSDTADREKALRQWIDMLEDLCEHASVDMPRDFKAEMKAFTDGAAGLDAIASGGDRKVLKKNAQLASELLPQEAAGLADANRMRILMGLPALPIDLKLCEAARGHSKDMAEKNFFAHDSPVPGKASPGDRARAAGTSYSGENIAINGSATGANMAWFFSPGHHKNFFGQHARIGLGFHNNRWTQMFGR